MPGVEAEVLRLVGQVYEVVAEPDGWPALLDALAMAVRAHGAVLREVDCSSRTVGFSRAVGYEAHFLEAYRSHYVHLDPYRALLMDVRQPCRQLLTEQVLDLAAHHRSEYFNDYERPQDRIHVLGTVLQREASHLLYFGLHRGRKGRPYAARDLDLIDRLLPHLERAVRLQGVLDSARDAQRWSEATLETLRAAVWIVDARGRPSYANQRAVRQAALSGPVFVTGDGCLACARAEDTAHLRRLIEGAAAVTAGASSAGGGALEVTGGNAFAGGQLLVSPLPRARLEAGVWVPAACAAVFMTEPARQAIPWRGLVSLFGLTAAEARLAAVLAGGRDLEAAARDFGVSIHTVRAQLKSVFAKTGTRRQAELAARVLGGVLGIFQGGEDEHGG